MKFVATQASVILTSVIKDSSMRPIAAFFAQFLPSPEFTYNPSQAPTKEFKRLARAKKWKKDTWDAYKVELNRAMIEQFNEVYGTSDDDITAWQALYARLGLENVPETLKECRKVSLTGVMVNN